MSGRRPPSAWLRRHIAHPLILWQAGESARLRYRRLFERTQYYEPDELAAFQLPLLTTLLRSAAERCPFYRERFARTGFDPDQVSKPSDLSQLPPLTKAEVQEHSARMLAMGWPRADLVPNHTGGSVGRPVRFFVDRDRLESRAGSTARHDAWCGLEPGDPIAYIWGAPRDRPSRHWRTRLRNRLLGGQLWLDTARVNETEMRSFGRALDRFAPRTIIAYASGIALVARFFESAGIRPRPPSSIITSAEILTDEMRGSIEEVFGCEVFDRYGSREVSVIASECSEHSGLHLNADSLYVEVVTEGRPAAPGELGSLVVTDLRNLSMPLIRYEIGDAAVLEAGPCACGRGLPRLRSVAGRVSDFIVGPDGRAVSGTYLAVYVVGKRPSLGQAQIVQDRAGVVRYRIQRGPRFDEADDLSYLREATARELGAGTQVEFEFVDELPREPSGKFLFSRSSVRPPFLDAEPR